MTIIKMLNDNRNKMKRKKMLKSERIKETNREGQPKGQKYRRDKITEGTKLPKGQNFERTFPKGQKKREKKRIARQHKLNEGEERKVP